MITYIEGKLIEKNPTYVVIECGGIGYFINISLHTYSKIDDSTAQSGTGTSATLSTSKCKLYTHFSVREDAHTLYGFSEQRERRLFRHLISVSGVGAATARMVLSSLSPEEVHKAIITKDVAILQSVKGIGSKTAERIIVDLKSRLEKEGMSADALPVMSETGNKIKDDALSALVMLGFAKIAAEKAINQVLRTETGERSVEHLIKASLKNL